MTTYLVHRDDTGAAVSVGSVIANPLPAGHTAVPLDDVEAAALAAGHARWDPVARAVVVTGPPPQVANQATLTARALAALAANDTYLAIGSPNNAQVVAQVNRLTKECSAIIRLQLDQLDTTTGT